MDINPVSLQLAASQLTAGNHNVSYRQMGLHLMPYGPQRDTPGQVAVGTLELLGQKAIVARHGELDIADDEIASQNIWQERNDADLEDAVSAVKDARIIIMNPPFTNRAKMGEKFPKETQRLLRARADAMERTLVRNDSALEDFVDKNSLGPVHLMRLIVVNSDRAYRTMLFIVYMGAFVSSSLTVSNCVITQVYRIKTALI